MILPILCALALGGAPDGSKATLGIDDIIRGIEKNDEVWRAQKSWMVRYTHSREKVNVPHLPEGRDESYADNEVVNARKGPWFFASEDQANPITTRNLVARHTWVVRKAGQYVEKQHDTVTLWDEPPKDSTRLAFDCFFYPGILMRDFLSDTFAIPEEEFQSSDMAFVLPRCLKANRAEFRVREGLDVIDSFPCHVVERPGKDVIWIDAASGFNVRRRRIYYPSGEVGAEFKASGLRERAPGIWLPDRQLSVSFLPPPEPEPYRGKVGFVMYNLLKEARFNDVPDSLFDVPDPLPGALKVVDRRKPKGD